MMFNHRVVIVLAAASAVSTVVAFSPLAPQHRNNLNSNIDYVVKESQRFQNIATQVGSSPDVASDEEDNEYMGNDVDNPPAEDYILNVGDLDDLEDDDEEDEDMVGGVVYDGLPSEPYLFEQRLDEVRNRYRRHETDTGSPEYQIAGMTERISYLTKHLQTHPKDFSTRRGLVALVNKRRRLLNYLFGQDDQRYNSIIASLGIRHKAPGRVATREEKYSRFPKQKAVKKHLVAKNKKRRK